MSREILIQKGQKKVSEGYMARSLKNGISEKILEIVGATKAEYFGTTDLSYFDRDKDINIYKFYKYDGYELVECSFGAALDTDEYKSEKIFIFSEEPEGCVQYYAAEVIE